jgi:hypothetical protein
MFSFLGEAWKLTFGPNHGSHSSSSSSRVHLLRFNLTGTPAGQTACCRHTRQAARAPYRRSSLLEPPPTAGPPPSRPSAPASSPHPNPKFHSSPSPATPRPAASSPYPMRSCPDLRRGDADHSGHLAVRRGQLAVCPHHHRIIRQGMSVLHFPDSATLVRYTCLYVRGIECRCACPRICSSQFIDCQCDCQKSVAVLCYTHFIRDRQPDCVLAASGCCLLISEKKCFLKSTANLYYS